MKTTMQGITEQAMGKAMALGIYHALSTDAASHEERMNRVVDWAIKRYGEEWVLPRYMIIGEMAIAQGMKKIYGEEEASKYYL